MNYDLVKISGNAVFCGVAIGLYDVLVDGWGLTEGYVRDDLLTFAVSSVASSFVFEIVNGLVPYISENNSLGMLTRPVLNGIVYIYVYSYMMDGKYQYERDNKSNFFIGSLISLIVNYVNNPLLSLFGYQVVNY